MDNSTSPISVIAVMVIYILILGVVCFFLPGCVTKPIPIVYDCPKIILPSDPVLALKKLTVKSTPDQVVKACWIDISNLRGWNSTVRQQVLSS
jgi:hypothetical protein